MLFSSLEFLYLFLPLTLLIYFLVPLRWRNPVLLLSSLIFYGWGEPKYILLMVLTILCDWGIGLLIARSDDEKKRRRWLIVAILLNLGFLAVFKYAGFIVDNLRLIPPLSHLKPLSLRLPIGISFYTFQALSYVIDVYRRDVRPQRSPVTFGTYVTLFPQLIAGPIVRYCDVEKELSDRTHSVLMTASGARIFLCGLAKKVLLANTVGALWASIRDLPTEELTVVGAWLGLVAYTLQMYFDFSGYSDMAIGLGRIFGFRFPENFYYPFVARTITDYWHRWHITLSTWFREYVYIPLGGNRKGKARTYLNLLLVWLLTGLWHGASWNFVLWGLYFFVFLAIERAGLGKWLEKAPSIVGHLYTLAVVVFSFYIFVFDGSLSTLDGTSAIRYLSVMFGKAGAGFCNAAVRYELRRNALLLIACILGATPFPRRLWRHLWSKYTAMEMVTTLLCLLSLGICTMYLVDSSFNPFLYFRF